MGLAGHMSKRHSGGRERKGEEDLYRQGGRWVKGGQKDIR